MMLIGEFALAAGVSVEAIRFYERKGVLPRPTRLASGYRVYRQEGLTRLRRIKHLQSLGLTLEEVVEALGIIEGGQVSCQAEVWRLRQSLERVDARLRELGDTRERIVRAIEHCNRRQCGEPKPAALERSGTTGTMHFEKVARHDGQAPSRSG